MYACMYVRIYVCMYIRIYSICVCVCVCVCVYTRRWAKAVGKPAELRLGLGLGALFLWHYWGRYTRTRGVGLRGGDISAEVTGFV